MSLVGLPVSRRRRPAAAVLLCVLLGTLTGEACEARAGRTTAQARPPAPVRLRAQVVRVLPHDPASFTQGLEIHAGSLYESSGHYGRSWVQEADLASLRVKRRIALPARWFGEGLTVVPGGVWQVTWRENTAVLRDRGSLEERRRVPYEGEGWGLCHDGNRRRLVMSDGSATLSLRDPDTFGLLGRITVRDGDRPVTELNELECTGRHLWANIWRTDSIARIDPADGHVTAVLRIGDLPGLPRTARSGDSLNGIAAVPSSHDLLITGKNWPHMYRIRPVPSGG